MTGTQPSRRVFATADIGREALAILEKQGYAVEVHPHLEAPAHEIILAKVRDGVDALITTLRDRIDSEVFEAGRGRLRVVAQDAVGFDNIDRAAANRARIPFTHTPDVLTEATAEFAWFILGAAARQLWASEQLVREKQWRFWHPYHPLLGAEVTGKTVAVIGTGRIGQAFIRKSLGFEVRLLCHDPVRQDAAFVEKVERLLAEGRRSGLLRPGASIAYTDFRSALSQADFVSLHVPLLRAGECETPTYHLLNEDSLGWMRAGAWLINTSRGPVVDEAALLQALRAGRLAGAALDVYETEPLPEASGLRASDLAERVRLYPHFASATVETRLSPDPGRGMAGRCVQALRDVLEGNYGGNPARMPYVVNKEAFAEAGRA